jgi:hypothetical protein
MAGGLFFCDSSRPKLNNGATILRAFLWLLLRKNPSRQWHLNTHLRRIERESLDCSGDFTTLAAIFCSMIRQAPWHNLLRGGRPGRVLAERTNGA